MGPAAWSLLRNHGLTAGAITPSGPKGNVTKGDILRYLAQGGVGADVTTTTTTTVAGKAPRDAAAATTTTTTTKAAAVDIDISAEYTDTKATSVRKVIAKRLLESKTQSPHAFYQVEVAMDAVAATRAALASRGVKVSVNDFVVKATALALAEVPRANVTWDATTESAKPAAAVDISIAVAVEGGLITPIVKSADQQSLKQISAEVKRLAGKAKEGKLLPEEFTGGSFSISNLGMFGVDQFYAIVNPPQGGILAVGGSSPKVVLEDGEPATRHVMTASLSVDARAISGDVAGDLLAAIQRNLERPEALWV